MSLSASAAIIRKLNTQNTQNSAGRDLPEISKHRNKGSTRMPIALSQFSFLGKFTKDQSLPR
jgi:hypothetical protein